MLNRAKTSIFPSIVAVMLVIMGFGVASPLTPSIRPVTRVEPPQREKAYTPPRGSAERKEILDSLRAEIQKLHEIEAIFVVNYLKVQPGWAWIETSPQSPDGSSRNEDVSALLRKSGGRWRVVEIACAEEENPDCIGHEDFFSRLMTRFPAAPREIFPFETVPDPALGRSDRVEAIARAQASRVHRITTRDDVVNVITDTMLGPVELIMEVVG